MKLHGVIVHEREQFNRHYTANRVNEMCYAISDTHVSLQSSIVLL